MEDFEEAERLLRRHGVEYSRHVLPGDVNSTRPLVGLGEAEGWRRKQWGLRCAVPRGLACAVMAQGGCVANNRQDHVGLGAMPARP